MRFEIKCGEPKLTKPEKVVVLELSPSKIDKGGVCLFANGVQIMQFYTSGKVVRIYAHQSCGLEMADGLIKLAN